MAVKKDLDFFMESEGRKKEKKTVFILLLLCRFKDKFFNFFLAVLTGTAHTTRRIFSVECDFWGKGGNRLQCITEQKLLVGTIGRSSPGIHLGKYPRESYFMSSEMYYVSQVRFYCTSLVPFSSTSNTETVLGTSL